MLTALLLTLIYFAFISLGLPDSLLGVSWPIMRAEWNLPLDAAGFISIAVVVATILSSLLSGHVIKKLGTGMVTFLSCLITGLSILAYSISPSYIWLVFLAFPLGFGAGSVDTALNNYVALHFKAHHMNWLHSFWGVGATLGPLIMANVLNNGMSWRSGYRFVGSIQLTLAFLLLISLPLWRRHEKASPILEDATPELNVSLKKIHPLKIKGVKYALATFTFYCAAEASVGLWGSSFLIAVKGLSVELAASYVASYYFGITLGRFISGFVSFHLTNVQMIRGGLTIALLSAAALILPIPSTLILFPLMLFGLGLAPIFPSMIHETPRRFGKENSQYIIGYQMASAYFGIAFFPPIFGILLKNISMHLFPVFLLLAITLAYLTSERVIKISSNKK